MDYIDKDKKQLAKFFDWIRIKAKWCFMLLSLFIAIGSAIVLIGGTFEYPAQLTMCVIFFTAVAILLFMEILGKYRIGWHGWLAIFCLFMGLSFAVMEVDDYIINRSVLWSGHLWAVIFVSVTFFVCGFFIAVRGKYLGGLAVFCLLAGLLFEMGAVDDYFNNRSVDLWAGIFVSVTFFACGFTFLGWQYRRQRNRARSDLT